MKENKKDKRCQSQCQFVHCFIPSRKIICVKSGDNRFYYINISTLIMLIEYVLCVCVVSSGSSFCVFRHCIEFTFDHMQIRQIKNRLKIWCKLMNKPSYIIIICNNAYSNSNVNQQNNSTLPKISNTTNHSTQTYSTMDQTVRSPNTPKLPLIDKAK